MFSFFNKQVTAVICLITSFFLLFTGAIDSLAYFNENHYPESSKQNEMFLGAWDRSQGITFDGEYYYFSSKAGLTKTEGDCSTVVKRNFFAIPSALKEEYGSAHIGGISYYNGKIYCGLEDSKVWNYPIVATYSAETLEFTGEYYVLDNNDLLRGIPWVAVDPDTGCLYAGDHSKTATKLFCYDTNNSMSKTGSLTLSDTVKSIQGGEIYKGTLYVATNDDNASIYSIKLADGSVSKCLDRGLVSGSEGEGMTLHVDKDGVLYADAIDMGPLFINAFVRHYKLS